MEYQASYPRIQGITLRLPQSSTPPTSAPAMKIDEHKLPQAVVLAWQQALERLPNAQVIGLADEQKLSFGFRPRKIPPAMARARLRQALDSSPELPEPVRLALRQASPAAALVTPLCEALVLEQTDTLVKGSTQNSEKIVR